MEKSIICNIRDLQRAIASLDSDMSASFDVGITEAMALCSILETPMITAGELAKDLLLAPPLMSRLINKLEKRKLLERVFSEEDHRTTHLKLTSQGKKLIDQLKATEIQLPTPLQQLFQK